MFSSVGVLDRRVHSMLQLPQRRSASWQLLASVIAAAAIFYFGHVLLQSFGCHLLFAEDHEQKARSVLRRYYLSQEADICRGSFRGNDC